MGYSPIIHRHTTDRSHSPDGLCHLRLVFGDTTSMPQKIRPSEHRLEARVAVTRHTTVSTSCSGHLLVVRSRHPSYGGPPTPFRNASRLPATVEKRKQPNTCLNPARTHVRFLCGSSSVWSVSTRTLVFHDRVNHSGVIPRLPKSQKGSLLSWELYAIAYG